MWQGPGAGGRMVHFHLKLTRAQGVPWGGGRGSGGECRGSESQGWSRERESNYAALRVWFLF